MMIVQLFHLLKWNLILDFGLKKNGYMMVELFFVRSGYVIFNAYWGKLVYENDLLTFVSLGLGRLYPINLPFLVGFVMIDFASYIASKPFEVNNL